MSTAKDEALEATIENYLADLAGQRAHVRRSKERLKAARQRVKDTEAMIRDLGGKVPPEAKR